VVTSVAWLTAAALSIVTSRTRRSHGKASLPILLTGGFAIACATTFFGPYFFLPGFAVIYGMMFVLVPPDRSRRWLVVTLSMLTILGPALLERLGVLPPAYTLGADAVVIHADMLHFPPVATQAFLLLSSVSVVLTACLMSARVHDALAEAQERLYLQAWQLRQMLPRAARVAAADSPEGGREPR
jgi:serine/threonine-protein kinase